MAKIRVLHVCNQLDLGGSEKTLQIFCKYMDKSRFEVVVFGRLRGGRRVQEIKELGIPVLLGPLNINHIVDAYKIDICHVHRSGHFDPGSLPYKKMGWPKIVETNVFNDFDPWEHHLLDFQLFVSAFSQRRYQEQHATRHHCQSRVLYNPVDFEEFPLHAKPFAHTIGRCSRADDAKWHMVCIDSLPKIFRKVPQVKCHILGATNRVRSRLARYGLEKRVTLFEPSLDVNRFYQGIDVFIHGAHVGETFGCVIAEAMANGIPVVTLSTPRRKKSNAQVELVEHNLTGLVCDRTWQYGDAVIELLKNHDLWSRFSKNSYAKAREEFDAVRLTRKLESIYAELMECST